MAKDVNLRLANAVTRTATGNDTAVSTEGGFFAIARIYFGTVSGTTPTDDVVVAASIDGGSSFKHIGQFPQSAGASQSSVEIARPVYVPKPTTAGVLTQVRLQHTVAGTTPSYTYSAYLEPLVSLAAPGTDEQLLVGVSKLV